MPPPVIVALLPEDFVTCSAAGSSSPSPLAAASTASVALSIAFVDPACRPFSRLPPEKMTRPARSMLTVTSVPNTS